MTGDEASNPYEYLFTTSSGQYAVARLLNMPHLEEESDYMSHCVGTSDSYINQMKRGEIEILSLREAPRLNPTTQKWEGETPVLTIEYNVKTGTIEQLKKADDEYLTENDPYWPDVLDLLAKLPDTKTDIGKPRFISKINPSELEDIQIANNYVLTARGGNVDIREYSDINDGAIVKSGKIDPANFSKEEVVKVIKNLEKITINSSELARNSNEINDLTKVYVGKLEPGIFEKIQQYNVEHVYTSFPEGKIRREKLMVGGKTKDQLKQEITQNGMQIYGYAEQMMDKPEFWKTVLINPDELDPIKQRPKEAEPIQLVRLSVKDLFNDINNRTSAEIFGTEANNFTDGIIQKLGLELCSAETGPHYRLTHPEQPMNDYVYVGMKPFKGADGRPRVFGVRHDDDGRWLSDRWARPEIKWSPDNQFLFRLRPPAGRAGKSPEKLGSSESLNI